MERNISNKLHECLKYFPAVAILGARQTGKTTLAKRMRPDWLYIDCEKPHIIERIQHDPELFFEQNPENIILDEAQGLPIIFNVLRSVIDENRNKKGRFILTGSSSPTLLNHLSESLAGRIAIVELGTFKANEQYQVPLSLFYDLFEEKLTRESINTFAQTAKKQPPLPKPQIQQAWLLGGYPEPVLAKNPLYYHDWMQNYFATYVNRDIAKLFPTLNTLVYQRFINMLNQLSGTIVNKSEVARNLEVSQPSVGHYMNIIDKTYMWRQLPSFDKNIIKSIVKMPKGHIRDSGFHHYLQKIDSAEALFNHPFVGYSFESFVIEEIIKGLQTKSLARWEYYYYRTRDGAEIDLILDGAFGQLPIEIKYGINTAPRQLRSLDAYIQEHQLPFGIVVNQANDITWLTRNILQIPMSWL